MWMILADNNGDHDYDEDDEDNNNVRFFYHFLHHAMVSVA